MPDLVAEFAYTEVAEFWTAPDLPDGATSWVASVDIRGGRGGSPQPLSPSFVPAQIQRTVSWIIYPGGSGQLHRVGRVYRMIVGGDAAMPDVETWADSPLYPPLWTVDGDPADGQAGGWPNGGRGGDGLVVGLSTPSTPGWNHGGWGGGGSSSVHLLEADNPGAGNTLVALAAGGGGWGGAQQAGSTIAPTLYPGAQPSGAEWDQRDRQAAAYQQFGGASFEPGTGPSLAEPGDEPGTVGVGEDGLGMIAGVLPGQGGAGGEGSTLGIGGGGGGGGAGNFESGLSGGGGGAGVAIADLYDTIDGVQVVWAGGGWPRGTLTPNGPVFGRPPLAPNGKIDVYLTAVYPGDPADGWSVGFVR